MKILVFRFVCTVVFCGLLIFPLLASQESNDVPDVAGGKNALLNVLTTREILLADPLNESLFMKYLVLWESRVDHALELDTAVLLKRDKVESSFRHSFVLVNSSVTVPMKDKLDVETDVVFTVLSDKFLPEKKIAHTYATFFREANEWKLTAITELPPLPYVPETVLK